VLAKPEGLRQLFGKFQFFCFADTFLYLCRKKTKSSSKILAAHVRYMCQHALKDVIPQQPALECLNRVGMAVFTGMTPL
ncbi:MAG: hypothetical protein FWH43_06100, partial [Endomicrobia bacterium]|nr:hypothetical protein [Endomicrobiia bacterium]